jgi:hypothetical protein
MIPTESLTDALAADLRDAFLASNPLPALDSSRVLLSLDASDLPCPRLVFTCKEPKRVKGMDYTGGIAFEIEFFSSVDRTNVQLHRDQAGKISAWLIALRSKKRQLLACRVYLHDLLILQASESAPTSEREARTTIRAEAIVTMAEVAP